MSKSLVFGYGRLNPPTIGHEKLVSAINAAAKKARAKSILYITRSHDSKKNPLTPEQKLHWCEEFFDIDVELIPPGSTIITLIEKLQGEYDDLTLVVGSDRVQEFKDLFNKADVEVNVQSAGERDSDSDGVEGASASKARKAVEEDNVEEFIKLMPKNINDENLAELFVQIKTGLEKKPVKKKVGKVQEVNGYKVGSNIRTLMGDVLEVVDLRTNHVVAIDENGTESRWFFDHICLTEQAVAFAPGTFLGLPVLTEDVAFLKEVAEYDTYGVLKYLRAVNEGRQEDAEAAMHSLLEAATKQTQSAALDVIAGSIGVQIPNQSDPVKKLSDIRKKAKTISMRPDQKAMYNKMLNSLNGLGMSVQLDDKDVK